MSAARSAPPSSTSMPPPSFCRAHSTVSHAYKKKPPQRAAPFSFATSSAPLALRRNREIVGAVLVLPAVGVVTVVAVARRDVTGSRFDVSGLVGIVTGIARPIGIVVAVIVAVIIGRPGGGSADRRTS